MASVELKVFIASREARCTECGNITPTRIHHRMFQNCHFDALAVRKGGRIVNEIVARENRVWIEM